MAIASYQSLIQNTLNCHLLTSISEPIELVLTSDIFILRHTSMRLIFHRKVSFFMPSFYVKLPNVIWRHYSYDGIDTDPMIACQSPRRAPSPAFFSRQINIHHSIRTGYDTDRLHPPASSRQPFIGSWLGSVGVAVLIGIDIDIERRVMALRSGSCLSTISP